MIIVHDSYFDDTFGDHEFTYTLKENLDLQSDSPNMPLNICINFREVILDKYKDSNFFDSEVLTFELDSNRKIKY